MARAILSAAVPADDTLARVYLARRGTWPPITIGPDLPTTVRWLEADAVEAGGPERPERIGPGR